MEWVRRAAEVRPSERQLALQELEFYMFIHFSVNTFTDNEWGTGNEDPSIFNPTAFVANQWVDACRDVGAKGPILTCKHHDGFCLWPSQYTEHSVKNSPWKGGKGDMVREVAEACRAGGIKFVIYLSPWVCRNPLMGTLRDITFILSINYVSFCPITETYSAYGWTELAAKDPMASGKCIIGKLTMQSYANYNQVPSYPFVVLIFVGAATKQGDHRA